MREKCLISIFLEDLVSISAVRNGRSEKPRVDPRTKPQFPVLASLPIVLPYVLSSSTTKAYPGMVVSSSGGTEKPGTEIRLIEAYTLLTEGTTFDDVELGSLRVSPDLTYEPSESLIRNGDFSKFTFEPGGVVNPGGTDSFVIPPRYERDGWNGTGMDLTIYEPFPSPLPEAIELLRESGPAFRYVSEAPRFSPDGELRYGFEAASVVPFGFNQYVTFGQDQDAARRYALELSVSAAPVDEGQSLRDGIFAVQMMDTQPVFLRVPETGVAHYRLDYRPGSYSGTAFNDAWLEVTVPGWASEQTEGWGLGPGELSALPIIDDIRLVPIPEAKSLVLVLGFFLIPLLRRVRALL